jgi:hypothetical protein
LGRVQVIKHSDAILTVGDLGSFGVPLRCPLDPSLEAWESPCRGLQGSLARQVEVGKLRLLARRKPLSVVSQDLAQDQTLKMLNAIPVPAQ